MDIKQLYHIIKKNVLLIIIIVGACFISSIIISKFFLVNIYEADAVMIINSPENAQQQQNNLTLSDYTLYTDLANSYKQLCKTNRILNQVLIDTKLPLTIDQLSRKINVTSENNTDLIQISVDDTDPVIAAKVANSLANVFIKEIPQIMKMDNVQIIDSAIVPKKPIKPNRMMIVAIITLLGILTGAGISIIIDYFDVTIKSTEQIEKILGVPVLGIIPSIKEKV